MGYDLVTPFENALATPAAESPMELFARKKNHDISSFVLALLNQNCPALRERFDGPRLEGRVNLTIPIVLVPIEDDELQIRRTFRALTKEFSNSGVAVFIDQPMGLDEAMLGFRWHGSIQWIKAKTKHMHPIGGGFFQLGFRMTRLINPSDHPALARLVF